MPSIELMHSYRVSAPPEAVLEHLARPENYIGLSPLVVEVRDVRTDDNVTRYTAVERFRFARILKRDNVIQVSLRALREGLPARGEVDGDVVSPGGVRMRYQVILERDAAGTLVTDTLWLHAPPGLLRFAAGQASSVQKHRGRVLNERLSRAAASDA